MCVRFMIFHNHSKINFGEGANEYDLQTLNLYQNDTSLPIKKGLLKDSMNVSCGR